MRRKLEGVYVYIPTERRKKLQEDFVREEGPYYKQKDWIMRQKEKEERGKNEVKINPAKVSEYREDEDDLLAN
jgi:hypothetical protein